MRGAVAAMRAQTDEPVFHRVLREIAEGLIPPEGSAAELLIEARDPFPPNEGQQTIFAHHKANVIVFGGAAGGGKTYGLIGRAARFVHIPEYNAVIFRRQITDALKPGALWSQMHEVYPQLGGVPNEGRFTWTFPSGAIVALGHLEGPNTHRNWQGAQLKFIGFDEGTHFTEEQFWYLTSRMRGGSGIPSSVCVTCNPDPDSFLAELIAWWIDQDSGYAIPERGGAVRWFVRREAKLYWADSSEELAAEYPGSQPKSLTFIPSMLDDNPHLSVGDPEYRSTLEALPPVERERLLKGNWKIRPAAGLIFNRKWFTLVDRIPPDAQPEGSVRYWDKAGSVGRGDRTASVRMVKAGGRYYVTDAMAFRLEALERETVIRQMAEHDGHRNTTWLEQEGGSGGKESAQASVRALAGYRVYADKVTGSKVTRWGPSAAQAQAGNIFVLKGHWNEELLAELHNADGSDKSHDDLVDAFSGAFNKLAETMSRRFGGDFGQEHRPRATEGGAEAEGNGGQPPVGVPDPAVRTSSFSSAARRNGGGA